MARQLKDLSAAEIEAQKDTYLWSADLCRGYALLALNEAPFLTQQQLLEIMDRLENALCSGKSPEEALEALKDYQFALSDWHC